MSNPTAGTPAAAVVQAPLMPIVEAPDLFADAFLTDERGTLLFLSLWGRDTAIQELLARMTVATDEGGIRQMSLSTARGPVQVHLDRVANMEKHTGRMPPHNLFGDLVHIWLYDRLAVDPDQANHIALLLIRPGQDADEATNERLWTVVRDVCHVPLLPHWHRVLLRLLEDRGWMQRLDGHGIAAWRINLGDPQLESDISDLVRSGDLTLTEADADPVSDDHACIA